MFFAFALSDINRFNRNHDISNHNDSQQQNTLFRKRNVKNNFNNVEDAKCKSEISEVLLERDEDAESDDEVHGCFSRIYSTVLKQLLGLGLRALNP